MHLTLAQASFHPITPTILSDYYNNNIMTTTTTTAISGSNTPSNQNNRGVGNKQQYKRNWKKPGQHNKHVKKSRSKHNVAV